MNIICGDYLYVAIVQCMDLT